jgi:hypothetical protein
MRVLIWKNLPEPMVLAKGRNTSGREMCDCETLSWPRVQVVRTEKKVMSLMVQFFSFGEEKPRSQVLRSEPGPPDHLYYRRVDQR